MKVLHGTMEIANTMHALTTGLNNRGIKATSINYHPSYLGYKSDIVFDLNDKAIPNQKKLDITGEIACKAIMGYDIFHFYFGTTLTPNHADLALLRNMSKLLFMHHVGSDVRQLDIAQKYSPWVRSKIPSDVVRRQLDSLAKFIPNTIVSNNILYEMVKPFYNHVHVLTGNPIDLDLFPVAHEHLENERPLVVHAPTSRAFKGSDYIEAAVEALQDELDFDFILVEGKSHEEAKKIYRKADVIVDQILCGEHGVFAVEAMAMGKTVIGYIVDAAQYPKSLPIVNANPDTIKDVLRTVIKDSDMRIEIGRKGRAYAEKYHTQEVLVDQLIELYQGRRELPFDRSCWEKPPTSVAA